METATITIDNDCQDQPSCFICDDPLDLDCGLNPAHAMKIYYEDGAEAFQFCEIAVGEQIDLGPFNIEGGLAMRRTETGYQWTVQESTGDVWEDIPDYLAAALIKFSGG